MKAIEASMFEEKSHLSLVEKTLPEIKKWKVGKEYTVNLKVRQQSMRVSEESPHVATFEILEAESV